MAALFEQLGAADYRVDDPEMVDYFLKASGAHLQYLFLKDQDYVQFIVSFDAQVADAFVPRLAKLLGGKGFSVSEHSNIDAALLKEFN